MTTKEISRYLKLHEITICKYAEAGVIPAIRIGRMWRFDKDVIDDWISAGQNEKKAAGRSKGEASERNQGRKNQGEEKDRLIWVIECLLIFNIIFPSRKKSWTFSERAMA